MDKIYPESGVELRPFTARHYDKMMNVASLGLYRGFIHRAIRAMEIQSGDKILDLGCGTGRNACIMSKYLGDDGKITGVDVSPIMEVHFRKKTAKRDSISFVRQRIDIPFTLSEKFDKVFMSFVMHGFPNEVRKNIIENISYHLRPGGEFLLLDYAEFDVDAIPALHLRIFSSIECEYAFDFIKRDWKKILSGYNFKDFDERFFVKRYVRLLRAKKIE